MIEEGLSRSHRVGRAQRPDRASETIGVRAMLVHAIDDQARRFYVRHGLAPSPTDELHLMILIKDITAALDATSREN